MSETAVQQALKAAFQPEDQVTVLKVQSFRKGDPFPSPTMEQMVFSTVPAQFGADLTMVKLLVGPPSPGPQDAESTSAGIGLEIWLPEREAWNGRYHAVGNSGWANGTEETTADRISSWTGTCDTRSAPRVAAEEGAVTCTTDSGYPASRFGSFMMGPDGKLNARALDDWSRRALLVQAVIPKALATAYYGRAPSYCYFDGASGGGRQGFHVAQNLPEQYDGIVVGVAALKWNEFVANLYPALVIQRDLGGVPMTREQMALASNAAIASADVIDGQHLGFIIDQGQCRYDPTRDPSVLSVAEGGTNDTPAALTRAQAQALNKFWYGMTRDGSVPDPAVDNGWDAAPGGNRLWYGLPRGTDLSLYADPETAFSIGADFMAVVMEDPALASRDFVNATGRGQNAWMGLDYGQLAEIFDRATSAETSFSPNNPDLSAFQARGGKLLSFNHVNDPLLFSQGATHYYDAVVEAMGGVEQVQSFFRMYMLPGLGHGYGNGTTNPLANPPVPAERQCYEMLVDWVEKGVAPGEMILSSSALGDKHSPLAPFPPVTDPQVSLPIAPYPARTRFVGGDIHQSSSYTCR